MESLLGSDKGEESPAPRRHLGEKCPNWPTRQAGEGRGGEDRTGQAQIKETSFDLSASTSSLLNPQVLCCTNPCHTHILFVLSAFLHKDGRESRCRPIKHEPSIMSSPQNSRRTHNKRDGRIYKRTLTLTCEGPRSGRKLWARVGSETPRGPAVTGHSNKS